jgi:hypothetical protein
MPKPGVFPAAAGSRTAPVICRSLLADLRRSGFDRPIKNEIVTNFYGRLLLTLE